MTQEEFKALDNDFEVCLCNGIDEERKLHLDEILEFSKEG